MLCSWKNRQNINVKMDNKLKIIGIPGWSWKFTLLKYAKRHKNIQKWETSSLCYECSRHIELLRGFDEKKEDFARTEYYRYQIKNKKNRKSILHKIDRFKKLYRSIKKEGIINLPIITDDGCRLDGSHRCAILVHLGQKISLINIVKYEDVYSEDKSREIRKSVQNYRLSVYGL